MGGALFSEPTPAQGRRETLRDSELSAVKNIKNCLKNNKGRYNG